MMLYYRELQKKKDKVKYNPRHVPVIKNLPSSFFFGYVKRYAACVGESGPLLKRDGGVGEVGWLHGTAVLPTRPAFGWPANGFCIVPTGRQ